MTIKAVRVRLWWGVSKRAYALKIDDDVDLFTDQVEFYGVNGMTQINGPASDWPGGPSAWLEFVDCTVYYDRVTTRIRKVAVR